MTSPTLMSLILSPSAEANAMGAATLSHIVKAETPDEGGCVRKFREVVTSADAETGSAWEAVIGRPQLPTTPVRGARESCFPFM
jgi:hypothetical protein